jgi:hypothetical protein
MGFRLAPRIELRFSELIRKKGNFFQRDRFYVSQITGLPYLQSTVQGQRTAHRTPTDKGVKNLIFLFWTLRFMVKPS